MSDSSSESDEERFSGIKQPTLLQQIKTILDEYRNDVQIIKELVQNADDAEATKMGILYEGNTSVESGLANLKYGKFLKTPALIFYNDAEFSDADWDGITAIYSSVKKDDPLKIGRFGLGFKSVFHMTDNPCIVSGENALFIDPHERQSDKVCAMMKIGSWKRSKYHGYLNILKGTFGFSEDTVKTGKYRGTMFWFSLRQTPSKLSDDIYRETEVLHLLQAFMKESSRSLLFLKTLCSVKMFVSLSETEGVPPSKRRKLEENDYTQATTALESMNFGKDTACYSVEVKSINEDLVKQKLECLDKLKKTGHTVPKDSIHWTFDVYVNTERKSKTGDVKEARSRWLIVNYLKGGEIDERTKELMEDKDLRYLHLVGLAAPISEECTYKNDAGHIFCYQPLPEDSSSLTNLPVHLNAFFALSQNRRQIRWPDKNDILNAQGDKKIEWNLALASEMFPEAYNELLTELVEVSKRGKNAEHLVKAVYNSVPNLKDVDPQWKDAAERYILLCKDQAILFTHKDGGSWVSSQIAVLADFKRFPTIGTGCQRTVIDLLLEDNVHVVTAPKHVLTSLESKFPDLTYVTPNFARNHMKRCTSYKSLTLEQKQDLLQFLSLELLDRSLDDLELLRLADNSFVSFSVQDQIYFEEQDIIDLFPGREKEFVSADVRPEIKALLSTLAKKGEYCIQRMTDDAMVRLLQDALKTDIAIVKPIGKKTKLMPWVKRIWNMIQTRFKSSLRKFIGIPIFPVVIDYDFAEKQRFCLLPLQSNVLYVPSLRQFEDKDSIFKSMENLAVTVTDSISDCVDYNLVQSYLPEDTSEGLVSLFAQINDKQIEKFNRKSSSTEAAALLKFVSERIHSDVSNSKMIFQKLKLFRGYTAKESWKHVALTECNKLYEGKQIPVKFPEVVLRMESDTEVSFARRLDIETVSETMVVQKMLENIDIYGITEKQTLMRWIINDETIFGQNMVQTYMKKIRFLNASDGNVYIPWELFDPSDDQLIYLFKNQPVFPMGDYITDHRYMAGLRTLGLKTRNHLTSQDIEKVCSEIQDKVLEEIDIDRRQCNALLLVMNEKSNLVTDNLLHKRCIIVNQITDENYPACVPLKNGNTSSASILCCPSDIKSLKYLYLVGSVIYMLNCEEALPDLSLKFGWQTQPAVDQVLEHLFNVVQGFDINFKSTCLSMIVKIYKWLSEQCECGTEKLKELMKSKFSSTKERYVWVGDGFQSPNHIYVKETETDIDDMRPLLHKLPAELSSLQNFFVEIGCRKSLDFDMYLDTLYRIKEESETEPVRIPHVKLRKLAIAILNKIHEDFTVQLRDSKKELFFPVVHEENENLMMKTTKQCTFCDAQWLKDMNIAMDDDIFYVHPEVPSTTAESLGVPSLRQQMLSNTEAFEEWGQEEPLTRRLRNLLDDGGYAEGSVVKELFQNADDAKASVLYILYDERENNEAKSQLISDGMAECQGPALWVYNDAKFTEEDFKNITKLSGGTKENDSTKIGKFGLGFCSVYNVTDVPSFVSGDNVVIFDPHTTFLGKALPGNSPGLRINFHVMKNRNMMKKLKNQFKPYDRIFDCKLTDGVAPSINGTLFRLPLRNKASEIADIAYTPSKVKGLLEKSMSMAANMLLFSQNVTVVKLFHLHKCEKDPLKREILYEAHKEAKKMHSDSNFIYTGPVVAEASTRKNKKALSENPLSLVEKVSIKVVLYTGPTFDIQHSYNMDKTETVSDWLVCWTTGSSEKMIKLIYEKKGAINLGAVAVPVKFSRGPSEETGDLEICTLADLPKGFYQKGHLFFFLPLPIEHKFEFHVNGQFAVTTSRQQLQISTEDNTNQETKEWNESLLIDPVTRALLYLLESLRSLGKLKNYSYDQLWPRNEIDPTLKCLQHSFYQNVARPDIYKIFEKDGNWFDISRCVFIDLNFRQSCVGDIAFEFLSLLTKCVIEVKDDIYSSLLGAHMELIQERTVTEEQFFLRHFFPNLDRFQGELEIIRKRNLLLCYAIKCSLKYSSITNWLRSNRCIPSVPDGLLRCPMELIDPDSKLSVLFCPSDGRFPRAEFTETSILEPLRNIGLISDFLSDSLVDDRARSIQTLQGKCSTCATERAGHLLAYLCESSLKHKAAFSKLQEIPFIPVKCKPPDWQFQWYADNPYDGEKNIACDGQHSFYEFRVEKFTSILNIFHSSCKDIVGCVALVFEERACCVSERAIMGNKISNFLKEIGMKGLPVANVEIEVVLNQLEAVASQRIKFTSNEVVLRSIYNHLEDACTDPFNSEKLAQRLKDKQIVYVSHIFTFPKNMTKHIEKDCKPYIFRLDDSPLRHCSNLCKSLGIVDTFDPIDLALIVQQVKLDQADTPLTPIEINAVINILTCFEKSITTKGTVKSVIGEKVKGIFGPDDQGILRDCSTMCFNDFDEIEKSDTMIYAHKEFTHHLARRLGVKPKAVQNLEDQSEDIEDFYQEEPLVTRLQRLVEGYPCDSGIFKELLQNADDAKATEIAFLKDYISHPVDNIVDSAFEPLQGPALCVFNNSSFSKKDLKGIQKLGRGSKSDDPSQTGRYGVGFNAVYNLTDAPSFYTKGDEIENGETICFFDPLAKFIPNVSRQRPGKRYKNIKSIKRHHSDMMNGYHENYFLCEQGTVFRFPLRTPEMAKSSDIKQEPVGMDTVTKLLDKFCSELGEVVLFLKNLRTVRVLTHSYQGYEEDFSITLDLTEKDELKKDEITRYSSELCKNIEHKKESVLTSPQKSFIYELCATERMKGKDSVKRYIIVQTLGFKENNIPLILRQALLGGKIGLSPQGGVALCTGSIDTDPSNYIFENGTVCKAFCFLPLPIKTGLPVHVHGYFSLDHESRRTLWKSDTAETCYRTLWNNSLIELVISPAYVKLLEYIKEKMFEGVTECRKPFWEVSRLVANYQTLFPLDCKINDSYWKHLTCCVYKELRVESISFLPCQSTTWYSNKKTTTLSWTPFRIIGHTYPTYLMQESSIVDSESNHTSDFNNILRRIGMKIAFVTDAMKTSMNDAGLEISCVSPETLIDFLGTFNSSNTDKCKIKTAEYIKQSVLNSVRDVERILEFCLKNADYLLRNLNDIPLMVTQDNVVHTLPDTGQFYVIHERSGKFNRFFPAKEHMFLTGIVASLLCHKYKNVLHTIPSLKQFGLREFVFLVQETGIISKRDHYSTWNKETPPVYWITLFWELFEYSFPSDIPEGKLEFAKAQIQIVRSFPLIPAHEVYAEQAYLVPPCDMKRLMNIESFDTYPHLQKIFLILNIPQIDKTVFSRNREGTSEMLACLMELIPNCKQPNDVIECLHINIQNLYSSCISNSQARSILEYFNLTHRRLNATDKLRDLPLFETHFGKIVALSKYTEKIFVEYNIPKDGLDKITAGMPDVILLKDTGLLQLFECLGIETCSWTKVYERYIIPNQEHLQREEFYKHIEFLSQHVSSIEFSDSRLAALLQKTAFIETLDGRRVKVSELFDPSHSVFKIMCEKFELVPGRFRVDNVLKFLRLIGLQTQMTTQLFIKFARKIEKSGNNMDTPSGEVSRQSKILISHLFHMKEAFFDQEILDELAGINFITPFVVDENMSAIHPPFNSNRLMCFEGAVLKSSQHISWTIASILPDEADPTKKKFADTIIDKLHISKAPSVKKLIQHCTNIGKSLDEKSDHTTSLCHSTVKAVMTSIYQALDEHRQTGILTKDCVRAFEMVPIIYSSELKNILKAKRVVNSCKDEEEIPPYLNKCPSDFAQYHNLFLFLGAEKEPTACVFADVLNNIKNNCGASTRLLPKESSDVKKAMLFLFQYLIQQSEELHLKDNDLFLVSKDETLEAAQMLIFGNNKYYERQLIENSIRHVKLLHPIEKLPGCKLKVEDCVDSLQRLPPKCRPHLLTDLVRERVILSNIANKDAKCANEIETFIHSRHFCKGFLRLIRHVYRSNNKTWNDNEERRLATLVENVSFQHASGIETTLSLACITDGEVGDEILIGNTKEAKSVHLEINGNKVCIYFDTSDQKWCSNLTKQLTVYLNSQVSKCLKDETLMILMDMIGMKELLTSINDFLSREKIEEYEISIEINEGLTYPVPGTFVPKCLHDYLDNDYGVIYEYEYKFIAFEVEDPAFTDSDEDIDEVDRDIDPTYIFIHIIRKLEQTTELPLFQEYEINDGTENPRTVKAYQLYKFVRKKVSNSTKDREIAVYERHFNGGKDGSSSKGTLSFKEARREIRKYLREAWTKPEMERRKIVKRLLLKWHPDKNPNNVEICTKVFQYIQQCLFRLEKGQDLIDDDENDTDSSSTDGSQYSQNWSTSWQGRFWRRHNRRRRNKRWSNKPFEDFDDWWSFKRTQNTEEDEPYHWYSEARRWMRQAESDIQNAEASMQDLRNHSFNWTCYKAHQGAEKSLKAAWYAENANKIQRVKYSHNLTSIASGLHSDIAEMASRLSSEAGDHSRMRYPDMFSGQQIPADAYTRENAVNVIRIAKEIISAVYSKHIK
ncbi:sacsin-like [Mercenaria mercenaria]|uniref:sacsin-like n=1 Tax=Mercenaria mercenaria TaxID=6596 RepID=UPI00234EF71B|nr:sacsin-like [Mercenaria mercenaria]